MAKKNKRVQGNAAVAPRSFLPKISRHHLSDLFGLTGKSLLFAVVEKKRDDNKTEVHPVVAVLGEKEFISLADGKMEKNIPFRGLTQNLYPAIVLYAPATDLFSFKSATGLKTTISSETLTRHFGDAVILR